MDTRIKQVHNNYKNLKSLLQSADIKEVLTLKRCFTISHRRMDMITNINILINILEKSGELDEFHIQPLEVICPRLREPLRTDLNNLITIHKMLIDICSSIKIPVYNEYAKEISDSKPENRTNSELATTTTNKTIPIINGATGIESVCNANEQINLNKNDESEHFEVVDVISLEIGSRWKDLARYLKLNEYEIEEIDRNHRFLRDKARESLLVLLRRKPADVKSIITEALVKSRRNDLVKIVSSML